MRIVDDPVALGTGSLQQAGANPRWRWKRSTAGTGRSTCCTPCGARLHFRRIRRGSKGSDTGGVKNDVRDAADPADPAADGPTAQAWIAHRRPVSGGNWCAPEPSWSRSDPVSRRIHAVLAKAGVDRGLGSFGVTGRQRLAKVPLGAAYAERIGSLLELIDILDSDEAWFAAMIAERLHTDTAITRSSKCPASAGAGGGVRRRDR